jgi:hypothetical protein
LGRVEGGVGAFHLQLENNDWRDSDDVDELLMMMFPPSKQLQIY